MRTILATSVALLLAAAVVAVAPAEDVESGLKTGDHAGAYNVKDCTGPSAGKSLCYR